MTTETKATKAAKSILTYNDVHIGKSYIVIPKIREAHTALGNVIITFDNGDRRILDVDDAAQTLTEIALALEEYYSR